jgi:signal peptidase
MSKLARFAGIASKAIAVMLVLSAVALIAGPRLLGWQMQLVLSGSMAPAFDTGSVIAIRPVDPSSIVVGDVVTYSRRTGPPVTHRVVGIQGTGDDARLVTKGDANEDIDAGTVNPAAVVGETVAAVPYVGYVAHFMRQPLGFLLVIVVPGFILILAELRSLVRNQAAARKEVMTP